VAGRAPPARVEGRPAVGDAEEREGAVPSGCQGVRLEVGGAEEDTGVDAGFLQVIPERLHLSAPDRRVLPPAGDQSPPLPTGAAHPAFELEEISPLGLGKHSASMDPQLGHLEPNLAQLAHDEDLEIFRCELRQFEHQSSPSSFLA